MVKRQHADTGFCHHGPKHWRSGESLAQQIDKADLLWYKHHVLATERLGRRCQACEDAWGWR